MNITLNQSTKIDFSTDDSKSLELSKTDANHRNVTSFYIPPPTSRVIVNNRKFANKTQSKISRLKKKVNCQQKMINMLVTWIKIYYEREQAHFSTVDQDIY